MSSTVTIFETYDSALADIIRNRLAAHDIPAFVEGELQAGYTGVFPVRVFVPEHFAEQARRLLDGAGEESPDVPAADDFNGPESCEQ